MALRKWTKDGIKQLTNREIKAEIMNRLGLDPKSKEDQLYYKRQLNLQYLRAQNYSAQQYLKEPIAPNENWLSTLRREQAGIALTAQQAGIKATPAQNRKQYAARLERGDPKITEAGILNLERQFEGLLTKNTRGYERQYEEFRTREVTTQNLTDPKTGEIIASFDLSNGEAPPVFTTTINTKKETIITLTFKGNIIANYNITAGDTLPQLEEPITVREVRTDQSIQEVKEFLESLADDLHSWQESRMAGNRAVYGSKARRYVGS